MTTRNAETVTTDDHVVHDDQTWAVSEVERDGNTVVLHLSSAYPTEDGDEDNIYVTLELERDDEIEVE